MISTAIKRPTKQALIIMRSRWCPNQCFSITRCPKCNNHSNLWLWFVPFWSCKVYEFAPKAFSILPFCGLVTKTCQQQLIPDRSVKQLFIPDCKQRQSLCSRSDQRGRDGRGIKLKQNTAIPVIVIKPHTVHKQPSHIFRADSLTYQFRWLTDHVWCEKLNRQSEC